MEIKCSLAEWLKENYSMKKVLVIDNYDSFVYNIVHILRALSCEVSVKRNDKFELDEVSQYDKVLISPGPGLPEHAGLVLPMLERYASQKSILGVCLGHQAIGLHFGAKLHNLSTVFHGVVSSITLKQTSSFFEGIAMPTEVCRYHSWVIDARTLPKSLVVTAEDEYHTVMGVKHPEYDIEGVQFHPESFLSVAGKRMLSNWVKR